MSCNEKTLASFVNYCTLHPDLRFWQALCCWSGHPFIVVSKKPPFMLKDRDKVTDTYYWEGRNA